MFTVQIWSFKGNKGGKMFVGLEESERKSLENLDHSSLFRTIYPLVDGKAREEPAPYQIPLKKEDKDEVPLFFSSVDYHNIYDKLHKEPSHYKSAKKTVVYEGEEKEQVYEN